MADLFEKPATARAPKKPLRLHSDTEIYFAVSELGAVLLLAIADMRRDVKGILGEALLWEAASMADLVRLANIAHGADKLPFLEQLLSHLEKVQYMLRSANTAEFLKHGVYARLIPITASIGKQAYGLRNEFHAPAPTPVT